MEKIEETYRRFFEWLEGAIPVERVVFIHYSTRFDPRPAFSEPAEEIRRVVHDLASSRPYPLDLRLPDDAYLQSEGDDFPYHYSRDTYERLAARWDELNTRL